jgi:hypothetical protein
MKTGLPLLLSTLFIPAMKVAVCRVGNPMRMVLDSPATSMETLPSASPMSMLLLPVVRFKPARLPKAMLLLPVVLLLRALNPSATLFVPVVLFTSASTPLAVFCVPVVLV